MARVNVGLGVGVDARNPSSVGTVRPSPGAALLAWDADDTTLLIQWDGNDGLPLYLEWDI